MLSTFDHLGYHTTITDACLSLGLNAELLSISEPTFGGVDVTVRLSIKSSNKSVVTTYYANHFISKFTLKNAVLNLLQTQSQDFDVLFGEEAEIMRDICEMENWAGSYADVIPESINHLVKAFDYDEQLDLARNKLTNPFILNQLSKTGIYYKIREFAQYNPSNSHAEPIARWDMVN